MRPNLTSSLRRSATAALLAALGFVPGCGDDGAKAPPAEPPGRGTAVLTERVKLLDEPATSALQALREQDGSTELEFDSQSGMLAELGEGDVLVVGSTPRAPNGALLTIESVERAGGGLVARARPAALREAFEELHVRLRTTLLASTSSSAESVEGGPGQRQQALGLAFPLAISAGSGENTIELDGSVAIDPSVDVTLDIDFAKFQLDELSLSFTAKETVTANLVGHGETSFDEKALLGSIPFAPITIFIPTPLGALPVVLTPGIKLEAGLSGGLRGDLEASVTQRASFTAGVGYRDGEFGGFSDHDSDFDFEQPTYDASANVKAWAGPKLEVLIYGTVGPFAGVRGFVEAAASLEGPPPCVTGSVDAGLTATAGMTFLADYSTTLFEAREELASFDSCTDDPNAPRPALTWARTYGRAGSGGDRAQAVLQASDGGYLVLGESGSFDGVTGFAASTWALRLDALGNVLWQRAYERTEQGLARAVAEVPGGFVVMGTTGIIKVDVGGTVVWTKHYTAAEPFELTSLAALPSGGLVLAGTYGADARAFALRVDAEGEPAWARQYAGDDFRSVRATSDGGVVLGGTVTGGDADFYVVKLDADGELSWQRALNNEFDAAAAGEEPRVASSGDAAYDVIEAPGGGFVVAGESYANFPIPEATPVGYYATAVLELDGNGELGGDGSKLYRSPSDSLYGGAYAVVVRPNGSTIVVGRRADTADQLLVGEDVLLLQNGAFSGFGADGNDFVYSGTAAGVGRGRPLVLTADGGALLAVTSSSFASDEQVWLLKLNRTASLDSPYRSSLPGAAFSNADATSRELTASVNDVIITAAPFTNELRSESTELRGGLQ